MLFFLLFCLWAAAIFGYIQLKKGEVLRFETTAPPEQVVMTTVAEVGTKRRWATAAQTSSSVVMNYNRRPNLLLFFILFVFGFIPGILYWMIRSKVQSMNVMIATTQSGTTSVQVTSNGFQGKNAGRALQGVLGMAPGTSMSAVDYEEEVIAPGALTGVAPAQAALPVGGVDQTGTVLYDTAPSAAVAPADWYPDPEVAGQLRYFDGQIWTEHRAPA